MEEFHQMTLTEWVDLKEQFRRELNNVRIAYIRVGYVLRRMEETKAYEAEGYKSVAEFAEKEHGLKPSTTSRWMSINREYSLDGYSMQLDPKYIGMNASQLTEMLGLPMEDRELVTPQTPRDDIRELKKLTKMPEAHEGFENIVRNFFGQHHGILERLEKLIKSGAQEKELIEAVSPSGNKAHRKDGAMIFLMENVIKFKQAGHSPEEVQWEELFDVAKKMIEEEAENDAPAAVAEREEEPEREPEKVEEAPEEAEEGPEVEERTAEGTAEDDEEAAGSQDRDDQEDVGGTGDEKCRDDEHVEDDDAEKAEEICEDDAQEAAPDEEPEEEFNGSMNPPVDNSEIAPAQKPDSFSKTLNEKGSEKIVDEQGKPSPERMSFKEYSRLIGEAEATCDKIRKDISESADWDAALKRLGKLENLLKTLKAEDDAAEEKE